MQIKEKVRNGKEFFDSSITLEYSYRLNSLKNLEKTLKKYQKEALLALKQDLNKTHYEGFMTEFAIVMSELSLAIKNLKKWMKPISVRPALSQIPANAKIHSQPYGLVLIMSPWNYPFQLSLIPLISAISAGNTAIIKPSAYSPKTSDLIEKIVNEAFDEYHVQVVKGGREENSALLDEAYDYIFFTGSPAVGKVVMQKASENLTPITLELGGKSPCIVDENAKIRTSAKRIVFGKLLNAGQTCVAPDYALVHENIVDEFIEELVKAEDKMLRDINYASETLPKIINEKHRTRISNLLENEVTVYESELYDIDLGQIPFTIIKNPSEDSPIMQDEIFGPILPIITYSDIEEAFDFIKNRKKPLALYLFTRDKRLKERVVKELRYGGGCINDTIMHIASHKLPFGGVGNSGMGRYHGKYGFDTFSSKKSVLEKWNYFDMSIRYHPYIRPNGKLPMFLFKH